MMANRRITRLQQAALCLVATITANAFSSNDQQSVSVSYADTKARYQAITYDKAGNIWISGTQAALAVSIDKGETWQPISAPGKKEKLQFRDIEYSANSIILLAAGSGEQSRIYRLPMENISGIEQFKLIQNSDFILEKIGKDSAEFYNCLATSQSTEYLYGDSINDQLFLFNKNLLSTNSNSLSSDWSQVKLPFAAQSHEGGFAASGTCIIADAKGRLVIGTGNGKSPRLLLKSPDTAWQSVDTPFSGGESSGIFTLVSRSELIYAFGGSLKKQAQTKPAEAHVYDLNSGNWRTLPAPPLKGAIYGSATRGNYIYVSNPKGVAALNLEQMTWSKLSEIDIWALNCHEEQCIGVGPSGTVIKF